MHEVIVLRGEFSSVESVLGRRIRKTFGYHRETETNEDLVVIATADPEHIIPFLSKNYKRVKLSVKPIQVFETLKKYLEQNYGSVPAGADGHS